jgi:hypothetical protein
VGLDELELFEEHEGRSGGELGGPSIEELVKRATDRKAAMAEHLPALAPDDPNPDHDKRFVDEQCRQRHLHLRVAALQLCRRELRQYRRRHQADLCRRDC